MDNYAEINHVEDCLWALKEIKKTLRWFNYLGIKSCPSCERNITNA